MGLWLTVELPNGGLAFVGERDQWTDHPGLVSWPGADPLERVVVQERQCARRRVVQMMRTYRLTAAQAHARTARPWRTGLR